MSRTEVALAIVICHVHVRRPLWRNHSETFYYIVLLREEAEYRMTPQKWDLFRDTIHKHVSTKKRQVDVSGGWVGQDVSPWQYWFFFFFSGDCSKFLQQKTWLNRGENLLQIQIFPCHFVQFCFSKENIYTKTAVNL